jgi:hypothetical protein
VVALGRITVPSRVLVIGDMGYLGDWPQGHGARARRAAHEGGDEFDMDGLAFVAVPVAAVGPFAVVGERYDEDTWARVTVRLADAPVGAARTLGYVGVDWARLALADVDALSAWVHDDALDGLADVAFWGRDEAEAAERFPADRLPEGLNEVHGWADLPGAEAEARAVAIDAWARRNARGLAVDLRPHSHHYHVMRQVRASDTESGVIEVGGAAVLGFATTVGDGHFAVEVDSGADERAVAVRIEFAG